MNPLKSCLYRCTVRHRRRAPREHAFATSIFQFLLDLDELDELARRSPLISRNRFNVYSFHDRDHLDGGSEAVRPKAERLLRAHGIEEVPGRIRLLTSLRVFGYGFNPVSYFFVEDGAGAPLAIIAEVHNTFHERKAFVLTRKDFDGNWFAARHLKHFYISPFSDVDHELVLRFRFPGEKLNLHVSDAYPGERPFFHASLTGERRPLTSARLFAYSLRFPFVTLKVMALIHWHALLLWAKRVPFYRKSASIARQKGLLPASDAPSNS
ncbi:MAG: DUF1365 domain-containing protein [Verrucomicrobiota bacterium]